MRTRKQEGQVIRIGDRWYVRYWERRNIGGTIERKRGTHQLGPVTTRGKRPPADILAEAERHWQRSTAGQFQQIASLRFPISWSASICLGSKCTSARPQLRGIGTFGKITLSRSADRFGSRRLEPTTSKDG